MLVPMNTPESVVGCSSCGALYTPGPGDRGVCLDCRRQAAASQPRPTPSSGSTPRPNTVQPVRLPSSRPPPLSAQRPNFALRRNLRRLGIGVALAGGLGTAGVTQRQHITDAWTKVQRHGISREWAGIQRKAKELWVAIRRETPWPVEEKGRAATTGVTPSRSTTRDATATRTTHHQTQVASTSTKRKSRKRGGDLNSPGSTP
jgi:hypothetical protein